MLDPKTITPAQAIGRMAQIVEHEMLAYGTYCREGQTEKAIQLRAAGAVCAVGSLMIGAGVPFEDIDRLSYTTMRREAEDLAPAYGPALDALNAAALAWAEREGDADFAARVKSGDVLGFGRPIEELFESCYVKPAHNAEHRRHMLATLGRPALEHDAMLTLVRDAQAALMEWEVTPEVAPEAVTA